MSFIFPVVRVCVSALFLSPHVLLLRPAIACVPLLSCLFIFGMLVCLPVCVLHGFPLYERYLRCLPPHSLAFHCCEPLLRMCTRQHECMLLMRGETCVCPFLPCSCIPLRGLFDYIPFYTLLCECSVPASPSFTIASFHCVCALTHINACCW